MFGRLKCLAVVILKAVFWLKETYAEQMHPFMKFRSWQSWFWMHRHLGIQCMYWTVEYAQARCLCSSRYSVQMLPLYKHLAMIFSFNTWKIPHHKFKGRKGIFEISLEYQTTVLETVKNTISVGVPNNGYSTCTIMYYQLIYSTIHDTYSWHSEVSTWPGMSQNRFLPGFSIFIHCVSYHY